MKIIFLQPLLIVPCVCSVNNTFLRRKLLPGGLAENIYTSWAEPLHDGLGWAGRWCQDILLTAGTLHAQVSCWRWEEVLLDGSFWAPMDLLSSEEAQQWLFFHCEGNFLWEIDKFTMWVIAGRISLDTSFKVQVLMKSVPVDLEFFRLWMILLTSSGVTGLRPKVHCLVLITSFSLPNGSVSEWGILALSSLTFLIKKSFMVHASLAGQVMIIPSWEA